MECRFTFLIVRNNKRGQFVCPNHCAISRYDDYRMTYNLYTILSTVGNPQINYQVFLVLQYDYVTVHEIMKYLIPSTIPLRFNTRKAIFSRVLSHH